MNKEYGTALFSLARENECEQQYAEALQTVQAVFEENPGYFELLNAPNIPMSERLAVIEKAFAGAVPEQIIAFLQLLCKNGRIMKLYGCIEAYQNLYSVWAGSSKATVTSAIALNDREKEALIRALEKKCGHAVTADFCIEKDLMGGVVVEIDGKIMDGSLRRRLHDIKEVMHNE